MPFVVFVVVVVVVVVGDVVFVVVSVVVVVAVVVGCCRDCRRNDLNSQLGNACPYFTNKTVRSAVESRTVRLFGLEPKDIPMRIHLMSMQFRYGFDMSYICFRSSYSIIFYRKH